MPQVSKKDHIAEATFPLLLQEGIKATSIDRVVKASGASKPTVYNHFADKAVLIDYVLEKWLAKQEPPSFRAKTLTGLQRELPKRWLSEEACRLYGIFMGEGARVPLAKSRFLQDYDQHWRATLETWCDSHQIPFENAQAIVDRQLVANLL